MKPRFLFLAMFLLSGSLFAQSAAINTTGAPADPSAILDVQATDKGVLIPRLTTAERNAISNPASGLLVYDSDSESFWYYDGAQWLPIGAKLSPVSSPNPAAGTIRWNPETEDFEGYNGTAWVSLVDGATVPPSEFQAVTPSDGATGDFFGTSVSVDGDYAIAGAFGDDDNGINSGAAYIYQRNASGWVQQAKLLPNVGASQENFGYSVDISGDYAIVGAYKNTENGISSGSAYIFHRNGSTWTQQAKLNAADAAADDWFGFSVSISGDYAVVGARFDDDNAISSGSAYVFRRSGTNWIEEAKLTASDASGADFFGSSVAIDGGYVVIGAPGDNDSGSGSGSAYIFRRIIANWTQQVKLTATDAAAGDEFGSSVAINGDYVVVGAPKDDDGASNAGSAYVFQGSGANWNQQAKLTAADAGADDAFGFQVAVDGEYVLVGTWLDDENGNTDQGSAYLFQRDGSSWTQETKFTASNGAADGQFGTSVSVSGLRLMVGANGNSSGSAYFFENQ